LLVTRKARTVGNDTKDIVWGWIIRVEERWKVIGSRHEKASVLRCIIPVILITKQGTKFGHNGDNTRECYVCSVECLKTQIYHPRLRVKSANYMCKELRGIFSFKQYEGYFKYF